MPRPADDNDPKPEDRERDPCRIDKTLSQEGFPINPIGSGRALGPMSRTTKAG